MAMSEQGYVIRLEHIQAAIDKATASERPRVEGFLEFVTELDALERSLSERVRKAKTDAGLEPPPLSGAARGAISRSADADREIDRVLTRKCNRADSAQAVVKEILAIAKIDMKEANILENWIPEGDPTKAIYSERYWKRRSFVGDLREFVAGAHR